MPTLNLFAACARVLIDPIADNLSFIGILDRIVPEARLSEGGSPDEGNFLLPEISVATIWSRMPDEAENLYEQKVTIVAEDDEKVTDVTEAVPLDMTDDLQRIVLPVRITCRRTGHFAFNLFLKQKEASDWGKPIISYPFIVLEPQLSEDAPNPFFNGTPIQATTYPV